MYDNPIEMFYNDRPAPVGERDLNPPEYPEQEEQTIADVYANTKPDQIAEYTIEALANGDYEDAIQYIVVELISAKQGCRVDLQDLQERALAVIESALYESAGLEEE